MSKILLVDDDQGTTRLLEHILSEDGHEVKSINNSDDRLPAAVAHTPIIFFTSVSDIEKKLAAFGLGANDYIVKPDFPQELRVRIKALMRNGIHG